MKVRVKLASVCLTAGLLTAGAAAHAQDEEDGDRWSIDGTITVVSDYRFRGYSLSAKDPAVQPELWISHESGFYVGFWASNLADNGGDDVEIDPGIGYVGSVGPVDVDVYALWYLYPGAAELNYVELGTELSTDLAIGTLGLELGYAPAQGHIGGNANKYAAAKASVPLGGLPLSFDSSFGIEDGAFGDKKLDWSLGVTGEAGNFEFGAHYIDAARHGHDPLADPTVVASVSYSF